MSKEESIKEAIKQFQEKYPTKPIPKAYTEYIKQEENKKINKSSMNM